MNCKSNLKQSSTSSSEKEIECQEVKSLALSRGLATNHNPPGQGLQLGLEYSPTSSSEGDIMDCHNSLDKPQFFDGVLTQYINASSSQTDESYELDNGSDNACGNTPQRDRIAGDKSVQEGDFNDKNEDNSVQRNEENRRKMREVDSSQNQRKSVKVIQVSSKNEDLCTISASKPKDEEEGQTVHKSCVRPRRDNISQNYYRYEYRPLTTSVETEYDDVNRQTSPYRHVGAATMLMSTSDHMVSTRAGNLKFSPCAQTQDRGYRHNELIRDNGNTATAASDPTVTLNLPERPYSRIGHVTDSASVTSGLNILLHASKSNESEDGGKKQNGEFIMKRITVCNRLT